MTTNPTQPTEPLSFKEYFAQQDDSRYFRDVVRKAEPEVYEWGEAYAAQQTAELTASIAVLREVVDRSRQIIALAEGKAITLNERGPEFVGYLDSTITNLPAAAQAHLDEVARLKAVNTQLKEHAFEQTAENERLKTELLTLKNGVNGSDKSCCEAIADTVADVKLLREALAWYDDKNATEALAQTDKEAYR